MYGYKIFLMVLIGLFFLPSSLYSQRIYDKLNPDFVKWLEQKTVQYTAEGYALGEIPPPFQIITELPSHIREQLIPREYLAPSFDLRTTGGLTSVKNQGSCGACWTFATMAALESRWKITGKGTYDLSEDNLNTCHPPFVWTPCAGGNTSISLAYLSRGSGPISENDDPYSDTHTSVDCPSGLTPQGIVTSGWFIPNDPDIIKSLIQTYGALATNMYWTDGSYNPADYTYYYSGTSSTNHAVTLVGWDDNKVTAGGTGAWIVKNSWGSSWGENGYFYIAYQDSKVNSTVTLFKDYIEYDPYLTISTYSESGRVSSLGYSSNTADALVKFVASGNVHLNRIGTYTTYPGSVVSIEVYDSFNGTNSLTGLLGSISEQTCLYTGYYTFDLSTPISIPDGDDYYIKIRYQTTGYDYPIPVEVAIDGYNTPTFETGKCWVKSASGSTWTSLDSYSRDLCIYAYTYTNNITFTDGSTYTVPIASPNSSDNPIGRFHLSSQTSGAVLSSVTVTFTDSFSGIEGVKLWSSSDENFGDDVQLGTTQPYSSSVTFSGLSSPITPQGTYYFVTVDLGASSGSVDVIIQGNSSFTITGGTLVASINNALLGSSGLLPVQLTAFNATSEFSSVILRWQTATEVNNYGFEVERKVLESSNQREYVQGNAGVAEWKKVGFVQGMGTSNTPSVYLFTDAKLPSGRYEYRLKQIDLDGSFTYSQSVEIEIAVPKEFTLHQNYPNPFNPTTIIRYDIPAGARTAVTLKVYDILGKEVATLVNEEKEAGSYEVQFDASKLSSGVYFYKLQAGNYTAVRKLLLVK